MTLALDCPRCHGELVEAGVARDAKRCVDCEATYTNAYLASRFYRPSEYIHAGRIGPEREGWDTPPEAA